MTKISKFYAVITALVFIFLGFLAYTLTPVNSQQLASSGVTQLIAPPVCGEYKSILKVITKKYGEKIFAQGLTDEQRPNLMELFRSKKTGGWTIVLRNPGGGGCIISAGNAFTLKVIEKQKESLKKGNREALK